jgi:hypothetical protein
LKQLADLTEQDFQEHPVWIGCHTADYDEEWYDDTDEETFRPRNGPLPATLREGMLLIRADATLSDGTKLPGFLTPASKPDDLGIMQPHVWVGERKFGFWGGIVGLPDDYKQGFLAAVRRRATEVFPLVFSSPSDLVDGVSEAVLRDWPESASPGISMSRPEPVNSGRRGWFRGRKT